MDMHIENGMIKDFHLSLANQIKVSTTRMRQGYLTSRRCDTTYILGIKFIISLLYVLVSESKW